MRRKILNTLFFVFLSLTSVGMVSSSGEVVGGDEMPCNATDHVSLTCANANHEPDWNLCGSVVMADVQPGGFLDELGITEPVCTHVGCLHTSLSVYYWWEHWCDAS